jgi:hypothetical protein
MQERITSMNTKSYVPFLIFIESLDISLTVESALETESYDIVAICTEERNNMI